MVFDDKDIARIIEAHELYGGNATEAAMHIPYSLPSIIKYWEQNSLPINRLKRQFTFTTEDIARIVEAHKLYDGNAKKTARHLPYSPSIIKKYWRANNLPIGKPSGGWPRADGKMVNALTDEEIAEIVKTHKIYDGNATEAAKHLPYSAPTIVKYWRAEGLPTGKNSGNPISLESRVHT